MICPVCRSQNMETAKFCGSCGHAFPRPSEPTSSLVNCARGHIYSAVYQQCPYCPQVHLPQAAGSQLETVIGEGLTSIEIPVVPAPPARPDEFITRLGDEETMIAEVRSAQNFGNNVNTGHDFDRTEFVPAEVIPAPPIQNPVPATVPTPPPVPVSSSPQPQQGVVVNAFPQIPRQSEPVTAPDEEPEPFVNYAPETPVAPFRPQPVAAPEAERRTTIVASQPSQAQQSKGKIIGWLISYSRNPDGIDYRIHAGYNRLGANPVCDIIIDDETVSGSHAIIVFRDGRCLIKDDLSRNGTFVNGREITEAHQLQNYDQVRVGNTYLTYISAQRI